MRADVADLMVGPRLANRSSSFPPPRDESFGVNMNCHLVDVMTVDGLRLHGAWHSPTARGPLTGLVVFTVHGVGGNFYSSHLFRAGTERLKELGAHVVWTNNRGHDGWTSGPNGPKRGCGASYEQVADCRLDLTAWVRWSEQHLDATQVVYWGHSLGAIKVIFASSVGHEEADATGHSHAANAATAVIASSPPLLSYSRLIQEAKGEQLIANVQRAEAALNEHDEGLLHVNYPFRLPITPRAYLDKYGPLERYDVVRLLPHVTRPLLLTYGEMELTQPAPPFANAEALLASAARPGQDWRCEAVARANHFYAQGSDELASVVENFLLEYCSG